MIIQVKNWEPIKARIKDKRISKVDLETYCYNIYRKIIRII